jgi:hypothetical protein
MFNLLEYNIKVGIVLITFQPAGEHKQALGLVNSLVVIDLVRTTVGKLGVRSENETVWAGVNCDLILCESFLLTKTLVPLYLTHHRSLPMYREFLDCYGRSDWELAGALLNKLQQNKVWA